MNIYWKLGILGAVFLFGWYCHGVYYKAEQTTELKNAITRATDAEAALIKFGSDLEGAKDAKDTCYTAPMPAGIIRLLK